jgi:hypothetical protein
MCKDEKKGGNRLETNEKRGIRKENSKERKEGENVDK